MVPAAPFRGTLSMSSTPASWRAASRAPMSSTWKATWMQRLPPALDEAGDGPVGVGGLDELDAGAADGKEAGADALVGHFFDRRGAEVEEPLVEVHGLVDALHGDADVVQVPCGAGNVGHGAIRGPVQGRGGR